MDFVTKKCQKGAGFRIIPEKKNYESLMERIRSRIDQFDVETKHLSVFHYKEKKVSVSRSGFLIVRDSSREEARKVAESLLKD